MNCSSYEWGMGIASPSPSAPAIVVVLLVFAVRLSALACRPKASSQLELLYTECVQVSIPSNAGPRIIPTPAPPTPTSVTDASADFIYLLRCCTGHRAGRVTPIFSISGRGSSMALVIPTLPSGVNSLRHCLVQACHTLTVPSTEADTSTPPSAEKHRLVTALLCPCIVDTFVLLLPVPVCARAAVTLTAVALRSSRYTAPPVLPQASRS
mmetsp:Transcript_27046/g.59829  ORF Transcript_27046/g.59829 Transcript_27046/m.59829 type:complete len:210 (-) Transcript_27046:774-1403(-)